MSIDKLNRAADEYADKVFSVEHDYPHPNFKKYLREAFLAGASITNQNPNSYEC